MRPPVRKLMSGGEVGEVVGRADDVGADIYVQRRDEQGDQAEEGDEGLVEAAEQRRRGTRWLRRRRRWTRRCTAMPRKE